MAAVDRRAEIAPPNSDVPLGFSWNRSVHVASTPEDTMPTRITTRLTARLAEIKSEAEKERAYIMRPGTSADAIARGGTKLVALTDELRTLQEVAREAETRDGSALAVFIAGAMAGLYARTAGRPEAVHMTDLANEMARMVRDVLELPSA
jgi:hypothetical protein